MSALQLNQFTICTALLLLQGLCVLTQSTEREYRQTGSSFHLPLKHPKDSVSSVKWIFDTTTFAKTSGGTEISIVGSRFSGRLEVNLSKLEVTVKDLQISDSGTYKIVADGLDDDQQLPTQMFNISVQNPVTAVQILKNQTWMKSTNSCEIVLKCEADGAENLSYRWSGFKKADGAQLQFSLQPADGDVTLNCTASNKVSTKSTAYNLNCTTDHSTDSGKGLPHFWFAVGGGGAAFFILILIFIIVLSCTKKSHKENNENGNTIYAEVTGPTTQTNGRSHSVNNDITLYETVAEARQQAPEMTIYAKVSHPQKVDVSAFSPYQKVS